MAKGELSRLSRGDLDRIAREVLSKHQPTALNSPGPTDLEALAEALGVRIIEGYLSPRGDILGMTVFGEGLVEYVTPNLELRCELIGEGTVLIMPGQGLQGRFTLAHELSHWLLHREYFGCGRSALRVLCREAELRPEQERGLHWLEWQANCLASSLLMPSGTFCHQVYELNPHFSARPFHFSGIQERAVAKNARQLSEVFRVSATAARVRMAHLGFVRPHG